MTSHLRKFALTAHITVAVGWLGAVVAYLALAVAGVTSQDTQMVRAVYPAMELIGWFVIVPFSLATLLTGVVQSLGTEWGLFRHYWVLAKFLLTIGATLVLLKHMELVSRMAGIAAETAAFTGDHDLVQIQLIVHAAGGLFVLLAATTLSAWKPWGLTRYGRRKEQERHETETPQGASPRSNHASNAGAGVAQTLGGWPAWLYVLLGIVGLVLLFVVVHHLVGGPVGSH